MVIDIQTPFGNISKTCPSGQGAQLPNPSTWKAKEDYKTRASMEAHDIIESICCQHHSVTPPVHLFQSIDYHILFC